MHSNLEQSYPPRAVAASNAADSLAFFSSWGTTLLVLISQRSYTFPSACSGCLKCGRHAGVLQQLGHQEHALGGPGLHDPQHLVRELPVRTVQLSRASWQGRKLCVRCQVLRISASRRTPSGAAKRMRTKQRREVSSSGSADKPLPLLFLSRSQDWQRHRTQHHQRHINGDSPGCRCGGPHLERPSGRHLHPGQVSEMECIFSRAEVCMRQTEHVCPGQVSLP